MPGLNFGRTVADDNTGFLDVRANQACGLRRRQRPPPGTADAHQPGAAALAPASPFAMDALRAGLRSAVADNRTDDPAEQLPGSCGSTAELAQYAQVVALMQ